MDILSKHTPKLKLTPADRKAIEAVRAKETEISAIVAPLMGGARQKLKDARWKIATEGPTAENVAELRLLLVMDKLDLRLDPEARAIVAAVTNAEAAKLLPIAERLLGELEKHVDEDHAAHKASVAASPFAAAVQDDPAARVVEVAKAHIDRLRARAAEGGVMEVLSELGSLD